MTPDEYVVRLWIVGEDLDPDAITSELGLEPTRTTRKGQQIPNRRKIATRGSWALDERPDGCWERLEDGLLSMTALLLPLRDKLVALSSSYNVSLGCAIFKSSFDGGPEFSVILLRTLADLGLPLSLDCYLTGMAELSEPEE
jgi:hypothetical protein